MWSFRTRYRLTELEIAVDEMREDLDRIVQCFDDLIKSSMSMVQSHFKRKDELSKDVEKLKRQMELTIRAQCATYSAALERVQTMLEFEKNHG